MKKRSLPLSRVFGLLEPGPVVLITISRNGRHNIMAQIVELAGTSMEVPADPDDMPILATLIAAKADVLVTGDGDLLALRDRYAIQTPAEFMRSL